MKPQVWIAISVYVLVAMILKELKIKRRISEILQILSLTLFEKTPLFQAFSLPISLDFNEPSHKQLTLSGI